MKLYTKRGDAGQTDLFGGRRVGKDDLRVEAYGTVDELNSAIGLAMSGCGDAATCDCLREIQSRLFEIGADLATPQDQNAAPAVSRMPRVGQAHVEQLEGHIDRICADLPQMRSFILPGGSELAARLHVARTVCRRAERICVTLAGRETIGEPIIRYLNRLSDLLFALARQANLQAGIEDVPWHPPQA